MRAIECFIGWILVVASIFVQACDFEYSRERTAREEKARAERQAQDKAKRDEIIYALKAAHNGDDTWDQGVWLGTWSVALQDRMVGKPIVSSGILVDVFLEQDGKHYLHLRKGGIGEPRFDFFLSCSKPELNTQVRELPEYFFAAKVQSVRKEARYTAEELMLGFSNDGPGFTVRGECLETRLNEERVRREQKAAETRKALEGLRSLKK
jgi:hypothetical protein